VQVATLFNQGFKKNQIRLISQKSARLVREYLELLNIYSATENQRLAQILSPKQPDEVSKKKSCSESGREGQEND